MKKMVRKFASTLILVVALVGSVSAQSLDDLRKKAYDSAIEAVNKGKNRKSAYEEYLERQEIEAAKKAEEEKKAEAEAEEEAEEAEESNFEENCNILYDVAIRYILEHDAWVKCYCPPVGDYIWYTIFQGDDNNWWINLAYNNNGSKGETFYATKNKSLAYLNFRDDASGKEVAAIKLNNTNDYIIVLQDAHNPRDFTINW